MTLLTNNKTELRGEGLVLSKIPLHVIVIAKEIRHLYFYILIGRHLTPSSLIIVKPLNVSIIPILNLLLVYFLIKRCLKSL
jgi:hypothetical protein